jgi:putative resolvase
VYCLDGVTGLPGQQPTSKSAYIYARVSSDKQRGDLERQIEDLQKAFPGHQLFQDIGSGVNFQRHGLHTLLERVLSGMVSEVVVMHRDRLARIGYDLLEFIFATVGTKLVVHCKDDGSNNDDLADDLLAITTHLVASYNGRRAADNRKRRRQEAIDEKAKVGAETTTKDE